MTPGLGCPYSPPVPVRRPLPTSLTIPSGRKRMVRLPDAPFLMIVEDVNKATQPINVVERIASWASADRRGDKGRPLWRLLTPVWPQVLAGLREDSRKLVETLSLFGGTLTPEEGQAAVRQRAHSAGQQLSDLQASTLSDALGHDPLLLALHEFVGAPQPANANLVISKFVSERLAKVADIPAASFPASDLRQALRSLGIVMLHKRSLSPTWSNLRDWLGSEPDSLAMLKAVCGHRELLRLLPQGDNERLDFRHDRIRDWLLADAMAAMMKNGGVPPGILEEPHWAEIIGAALAHWDAISDDWTERVRAANPLALFYAFQQFGLPTAPIHRAILLSIDAWLKDPATHDRANAHLRWEVERALADTDSPLILKFSAGFPRRSLAIEEARFRNGDLLAGVSFCRWTEPGVRYPRRDHLIAHVMDNHGRAILEELDQLLRHPSLTPDGRRGALYLAGHIGRSDLYDALFACWEACVDRSQELDAFLWAAARCAPESGAEVLLAPICQLWGSLPEKVEGKDHSSPRFDLVGNNLRFAFSDGLPNSTNHYLIERAQQEDLRRIIVYALHGLDCPDVLEFVARELAAIAREMEGTNWISPLAEQIRRHWNSPFSGRKRMSTASRSRLLQLWQSEAEDKFVRRNAFWLWAGSVTKDDFSVLRSLPPTSLLYDKALVARLKAGDRAAIPELCMKLSAENDRTYWWQFARDIWCDALNAALERQFEKRRGIAPKEWDQKNNTDWITSELIMRLGGASAESMLERHWDHLRYSSYFVHAALYVATPKTCDLATEALAACPNKSEFLRFVTGHFGIRMQGHPGVVNVRQIDSLIPYLDHLDPGDIYNLWDLCRERGWLDWRRSYLDHRLDQKYRPHHIVDDSDLLAGLDEFLDDRKGPNWIDRWLERRLQEDRLSIDHIMTVVRTWLYDRRSMPAFQIAAEIVAQGGRRTDLHILDVEGIEPVDEVAMLRADTCFATCRRTLV